MFHDGFGLCGRVALLATNSGRPMPAMAAALVSRSAASGQSRPSRLYAQPSADAANSTAARTAALQRATWLSDRPWLCAGLAGARGAGRGAQIKSRRRRGRGRQQVLGGRLSGS